MSKTHEQFINELAQINPSIEVIGAYTKAQDSIQVKCKICGYIWNPKAYSLTQGKSCRYCSAKRGAKTNKGRTGLKTQEQFLDEMRKIDPSIVIEGEYINGHTNIKCFCRICSNRWESKPYSLLQKHGCPRCAKSGTSFMEQFIRLSFAKLLGSEYVFGRDRTAIGMELDIYIPKLNVAIEPGNWHLHKKNITKDVTKRLKCNEIGIRLFTIYDRYPSNSEKPFEKDCWIFSEDLNIADHTLIRNLVLSLFKELSLQCDFSENEWLDIEASAYKHAKAMTHEDFFERIKEIHPNIAFLETYKNANKRMQVKCTNCGNVWNAVPANLLSGDGCKKCGTKKAHEPFLKKQADFEAELSTVNPHVKLIGTYQGRHNKVLTKCLICGHEWEPVAKSLLRGSLHRGWHSLHKMEELK